MSKLKLWNAYPSWEEAEKAWDSEAEKAKARFPVKQLKTLPSMPGMTPETAKHLKWKSFKYMVFHKEGLTILRHIFKKPFKYGLRYLRSLIQKQSYTRDEDFFFYNCSSLSSFISLAKEKNTLLVVGFSYCQKPLECPSGRFTPDCIKDMEHPVCQQCPIGKVVHALPEGHVVPLLIPTVHYIGDQIFRLRHAYPEKPLAFLITACEMTLEMFGDWGKMAGIQGIGIRLDGRICNTMRAFELSEQGIKPGLTVLTDRTQRRLLDVIRQLRS